MTGHRGESIGERVGEAAYRTIAHETQAEIVEKKSRFIAAVAPVQTEADALAFLERVRSEHRMARHHVYAYVLRGSSGVGSGDPDTGSAESTDGNSANPSSSQAVGRVRYSDDGEPQKTAGLPTLTVIQHAGLQDVIIVTTRYFGGTLLGTGGLVRAYTQAAQAAIDAAEIMSVELCVTLKVLLGYEHYEQALRIAESAKAKVRDTSFTEVVELDLLARVGGELVLCEKLKELTRGTAQIEQSLPFETAF